MNHKFLSLLACMALVFSAKALEAGDANIYASGLKVKGNNIEFMLNATPKLLTVNFYHESSLIHSLVIDNGVKGLNKVSLLGVFEDILPNTPLSWEVVVEADSHTSTRSFSAFAAGVAQLSEGGDVSAEAWSAAAAGQRRMPPDRQNPRRTAEAPILFWSGTHDPQKDRKSLPADWFSPARCCRESS